jgi:5-methylthioribose kinase
MQRMNAYPLFSRKKCFLLFHFHLYYITKSLIFINNNEFINFYINVNHLFEEMEEHFVTTYHPLTPAEAISYAQTLKDIFPSPSSAMTCQEIGDGNLNLVFRVIDPTSNKSVILKQALPYAKVVGESWPLTLHRAKIESDALLIQAKYCPDLVPRVYAYDEGLALTVMEDLSDHIIMRKGLMQQQRYPLFAEHMGRFLAHTLFFTSDLGMNQQHKKQLTQAFVNPELCKITEDLIFDHPYWSADTNHFDPHLQADVERIWQDHALHLEVAFLRESFLTHAQALIHGDLHTGSIFITPQSTKVIDPEFAFYGPMGFDIGAVFANLLLNHAAQNGLCHNDEARESYRQYLMTTIQEIWQKFETEFRQLWNQHSQDRIFQTKGYLDQYMQKLLQDAMGFTGAKMIRRIVGLAHVADIEQIADRPLKHKAQRIALEIGCSLIKSHRQAQHIEQFTQIAKQVTLSLS